MYSGDFLKQIEELKYNRGVPVTEIARELGVRREYIHQLRNGTKPVTRRILKRADVVFPDLLEKNPPLRGSPKFREEIYLFRGKKEREESLMDATEKIRIRSERLTGTPDEAERDRFRPMSESEWKTKIREEERRQAGERYRVWYENLRKVWRGLK